MANPDSRRKTDKRLQRIMLVHHEQNTLNALAIALADPAYHCESIRDPKMAKKRARNMHFDLILCNYQLPGTNGVQLVQEIKTQQTDIASVILTGFTNLGTVIDAVKRGDILCYINKPFENIALRKTVKLALQTGRLTSSLSSDLGHNKNSALAELEAHYPGITEGKWTGSYEKQKWQKKRGLDKPTS